MKFHNAEAAVSLEFDSNSSRRFDADDGTIRKALEDADCVVLRAALYQMTGDETLREIPLGRQPGFATDVAGIVDPDHQAELRERAFEVLRDYRDGRFTLPQLPSRESFHRILSMSSLEPVDEAYIDMLQEELGLHGSALRDLQWRVKPGQIDQFKVLVIGAGPGGICAGMQLEKAGIPYTVIEKNAGVGGTWYENIYPDARVDVASHYYSYSFEPNYPWKHFFAPQPEIKAYLEHCAEKYGVAPRVQLNTEVERAHYDEYQGDWVVTVRLKDGSERTLRFNAIISAVGFLNRPKMPDIEGLQRYSGKVVHTSRWDPKFDYLGKRVAIVGTGASGMQIARALALNAQHLTIFQRSAAWVIDLAGYRDPITAGAQWLFKNVPYYAHWFRYRLYNGYGDSIAHIFGTDPEWNHPDSLSETNEKIRQRLLAHLERSVGSRPELLAKLIPKFPPFSRRIVVDNDWLATLMRDNVELVTEGISHFTERGLCTLTGREHEFDLIVVASGFEANRYLWPMEVRGRNSKRLQDVWSKDGPRAYLGIMIPEFPNLFCLYGPNTNPRTSSVFSVLEMQVGFTMKCLRELIEKNHRAIEVSQQAYDSYNTTLDETLKTTAWMDRRATSYYRNEFGRVGTNMPWTSLEYWELTKEPDFSLMEFPRKPGQAVLDRLDSVHRAILEGTPADFYDMSDVAAARRRLSVITSALKEALSPTLAEVVTEDRQVWRTGDAAPVMIRIYRPAGQGRLRPALLWMHGGGMIMGDIELTDATCRAIVLEGDCVVISVGYRLAPEFPYPAALEDCSAALNWIAENGTSLQIDPTRVAVGGSSAGAGLAAAVCLLARDQGSIVSIAFQLLFYPMLDDRHNTPSSHQITDARVWNRNASIQAWKYYLGSQCGAAGVPYYAAPARASDLSGLPPAYLAVGDLDLARDETIEYAQRLLHSGVPTELHVYAGAVHGSEILAPDSEVGRRWLAERRAMLRRAYNTV